MKTDEEIAREVAELSATVGPTHAGWYAEACRVEYTAPHDEVMWACRVREAVRAHARDLGGLAEAAKRLLAACSRLDGCGGERVREAMEAVEAALWWEDRREAKGG